MEAYRHTHHAHGRTSHLTKLYSDTKKSALTSINVYSSATEQFPDLRRKFKIQKDRLITWGLAWSDEEKGADGNIDDAVAKAGLTETVDSVLRNVKEVLEEAERIQQTGSPLHHIVHVDGEKTLVPAKPATFDQARYEDLLQDLTTSIDTLYDLSRSRRALARGEHPSFKSTSTEQSSTEKPSAIRKSLTRKSSFASSEITLVNPPSFHRPSLSPYAGLPPSIEAKIALRLPEEGPPPYESIGVPPTTRLVAYLIRAKVPESVQNRLGSGAAEVPVLVEFANFDPLYQGTGVTPSLQRLEALAAYLQPMRSESQSNLSLLGYFEDSQQPRIGLVYDVPYSIQNRLQATVEHSAQNLAPVSLLKLVQKASKTQPPQGEIITPPLEDRFRLALRLTEQLHSMHACELAHGNINSGSIVFTMTADEPPLSRIRTPLWSSFDLFSKCNYEGTKRAINLNVYRHPSDTPSAPNRILAGDVKSDLYSFALVLLEIGLWTPLGDFYKPKYSLADFKLRLERIWIPKLAQRCGSAYMRAVEACVRIADTPDTSGLTVEGIYGPLISRLRRCCLIDDDESSMDMSFSSGSFGESALLPYGSKAVKSWQASSESSPIGRQLSDPDELLRSQSSSSVPSSAPSRLASLPNLAAGGTQRANIDAFQSFQPPISRKPSTRSQLSQHSTVSQRSGASQIRDKVTRSMSETPSFQDYKRKVTLLQQRWRERCSQCRNARVNRTGVAHPVTGGEVDDDTHNRPAGSAEQSLRPRRQCFPDLEIPRSVLDQWEKGAMFQLAKLCEKALKGSAESSSVELAMYGESAATARPTYLITCRSTAKVKQVLKRHFRHDPSICDLRVKKTVHEIKRCRRSKRHGDSAARRTMAPASGLDGAANPDYQERPLCGASIGAFRDDEHLPPVSFGGIVMVDDTAYGMSVHHMLEPPEDDEDALAGAEDEDSDTSSVGSADNISVYSHSDDESTVRPSSTVDEGDEPAETDDADAPGIMPDDFEEIVVTQPALDDAIECNLHVDVDDEDDDEDSGIDEDHLLSYKLGQVFASSGLKRTTVTSQQGFHSIAQSVPQEVDWALFELVPPRVQPFNIVKGGTKFCATGSSCGDSFPVAIRESSQLACAKVHCLGRTSGLSSGVISSTMELVKIHGRDKYSASWAVGGDFGAGGDSGAWVISNDDGRVCGHVLASKQGRTYICPMDLLLNDIKETLKARTVALPTMAAAEIGKMSHADAEKAVTEAVSKLRLGENETGGVPLPVSPARRSMKRNVFTQTIEAVETAG